MDTHDNSLFCNLFFSDIHRITDLMTQILMLNLKRMKSFLFILSQRKPLIMLLKKRMTLLKGKRTERITPTVNSEIILKRGGQRCQYNRNPRWRMQWLARKGKGNRGFCRRKCHSSHTRVGKLQLQVLTCGFCQCIKMKWQREVRQEFIIFRICTLWKLHVEKFYPSPIRNRGLRGVLPPALTLRASPNFSVTIHSFTLTPSIRPIKVAFVRCSDITFSKRIQKINRWSDLQPRK